LRVRRTPSQKWNFAEVSTEIFASVATLARTTLVGDRTEIFLATLARTNARVAVMRSKVALDALHAFTGHGTMQKQLSWSGPFSSEVLIESSE
jgi:hypothetical protein